MDAPLTLSSTYRWGITVIITILALVLFSPLTVAYFGYIPAVSNCNPQVTYGGAPTLALYLGLVVIFALFVRLVYEFVPIDYMQKWRFTIIATILALILFAPFFASAIALFLPEDGAGIAFIIQLILFLLFIRLTLR